jgi:hypothetical protein
LPDVAQSDATFDPNLFGLGDASPMEDDEQDKGLITAWTEKDLAEKDLLDTEVLWTTLYHDPHARGGRLATTAL